MFILVCDVLGLRYAYLFFICSNSIEILRPDYVILSLTTFASLFFGLQRKSSSEQGLMLRQGRKKAFL